MFYDLIDRYCNWLFGEEDGLLLGAIWRALISSIAVLIFLMGITALLHFFFPATRAT